MQSISPGLLDQYKHPLHYMSQAEYKKRRAKTRIPFVNLTLLGLGFFAILWVPDDLSGQSYYTPAIAKGGVTLILVGIGLPLYGIYKLATIRFEVAKEQRSILRKQHAELAIFAPKAPRPLPPLRTRIIIYAIAIVIITVLFTSFAFWLTNHT